MYRFGLVLLYVDVPQLSFKPFLFAVQKTGLIASEGVLGERISTTIHYISQVLRAFN
jgi:hypothetical protein